MNKSRKFAALLTINILLMFVCGVAHAQLDEETEGMYIERPRIFSVGLISGANFCQVDGDSYAGYYKTGANFGGIGYARVYKHVALSFELLYSQKGAKDDGARYSPVDSATLITDYGVTLNYAEIPVMINYIDKHKSHFGLGFSYARLASSKESMATLPATTTNFNLYPFKKDAYDLVAGAQMHIWKGLFLNVRFQYGLLPIRTYSPPGFSRAQKQYNNMWTMRLMYLFI